VYFPKIKTTLPKEQSRSIGRRGIGWSRTWDTCGYVTYVWPMYRQPWTPSTRWGDELSHDIYMHCKVTCSAIFADALQLAHHPGPNPEDGTTVRAYGHTDHRENGAYRLEQIKQFLQLFPAGPGAVAIGINAFLALRKPEVEALLPDDFDKEKDRIRIHRHTKTGNDEWLPVVAPLRKLLAGGWEQINLRRAEYAIRQKIEGTNLTWKGWYLPARTINQSLPPGYPASGGLPSAAQLS
jgi:hypothetical protein